MRFRQRVKRASALLFLICLITVGAAAQTASRPDRGVGPLSSYSVSDIENVNTTNGDLQLTIPLASLPPIPGGRLQAGMGAHYDSKIWDVVHKTFPASPPFQGYTSNQVQLGNVGGWRVGPSPYFTITAQNRLLDFDNSLTVPSNDPNNPYVWKMVLTEADGAQHELRPVDYQSGTEGFAFGFYKDTPATVNPASTLRYYSFDGTYLYATIDPYQPGGQPTSWSVWQRDGTRITMNMGVETITDTNGNQVQISTTSSGTLTTTSVKQIVNGNTQRHIDLVVDSNVANVAKVIYPTVGGTTETITINFGTTSVFGHIYPVGDPCHTQLQVNQGIPVVKSIVLPQTELLQTGQPKPGRQYTFTYDSDSVDNSIQNLNQITACGQSTPITSASHGLGSLSKMQLPSMDPSSSDGVTYTYSQDGVYLVPDVNNIPGQTITQRTLSLSNPTDNPIWTYSIGFVNSTVTGPDGSVTSEDFFNKDPALASYLGGSDGLGGRAFRTTVSNSSGTVLKKVERHWSLLLFNGAYTGTPAGVASFNPVVDKEYTTLFDPTGTTGQLSTKSFTYDYNGNLLTESDYDFVDQGTVQRDSNNVPTGTPGTLLRTVNNTFYNAAPPASGPDPGSNNVYAKRTPVSSPAPLILIALQETTVGASDVQYSYDNLPFLTAPNRGNLTLENRHDDVDSVWLGTSRTYDSSGNLLTTTDPKQNSITFGYSDPTLGLPTSTTADPKTGTGQQTSSVAYDPSTGLPTSKTDVNGNQTTIGYINNLLSAVDPFGRPAMVTGPKVASVINGQTFVDQQAETLTYYHDAELQVVTATDLSKTGDGLLKRRTTTDEIGRVKLVESTEDGSTYSITGQTLYFSFGKITMASNPSRGADQTDGWTRTTKDEIGRVVEVATFSGSTQPPTAVTNSSWTGSVVTSYSANQTTVTDQVLNSRSSLVDGLGRLVQVNEDPSGQNFKTQYGYDPLGNLTSVSQGQQQTRTYTYDSMSRLRTAKNPEQVNASGVQVATTYSYDNASNLQTKNNPNGTSVGFTYDGMNRVMTKTLSTGPTTFNYTYDTAPGGIGKLTSVLLQAAIGDQMKNDGYSYSGYDALGRPTGSQQVTQTMAYPLSYGYDLAGHLTSETYPSGKVVLTGYDSAGRLNGVTNSQNKTYVSSITYTAPGPRASMTLVNNLVEHTTYNSRLQPTLIGLGTSTTDSSTLKLDYTYGVLKTDGTLDVTKNNGNPQSQTITVGGTTTAGTTTPPTVVGIQSYTYDTLNRLGSVAEALTAGGTAVWSQTYQCDQYGNMAVTQSPGMPLVPQTPQALNAFNTSTNQIQTPNTTYDASGNLTNDGHGSGPLVYDAENYMTACTVSSISSSSISSSYDYDGHHYRVLKKVGSASPTTFVYDIQGRLIAEYGGSTGSFNASTSYLTTDHLGSTRIVTNSSGAVIARHDYLPFGSEIQPQFGGRTLGQGYNAADDTRQKFTSKERDNESGLDYFEARYYSSMQGRFTSPDEFAGGPHEFWLLGRGDPEKQALPYADIDDPQSLNKYQYCYNNPLRYVDPDGHQEGAEIRQDLDIKDLLAGRITEQQYWDRQAARAVGAGIGVAAVLMSVGGAQAASPIFLWAARNPDKLQQLVAAIQEAGGGPPGAITGAIGGASKTELSIAQKLASEGKNVEILAPSGIGKTADFLVNGFKAELKTLGEAATAGTVKNRLAEAVGQGGGNVIIDARNAAGVTLEGAQKAAARVFGADSRLRVVRIIGKGFDITITRK
jgi:RHS repeat-associated protein